MIESNTEKRGTERTENRADNQRGRLEEKYFRRIEKYDGNAKGFREWIFNIEVALGQIDKELAYTIREIIRRDDVQRFPESWDPK
eukprot:1850849-Karenia_brevis.AAC.1